MEDPAQPPSPAHRAQAEETIRKLRGKRFYLWPLLWTLLFAVSVGIGLACDLQHHFSGVGSRATAIGGYIALGGGTVASVAALLAGFLMGRQYWKAEKTLTEAANTPIPPAWKYPLLFAFAQWGLMVAYATLLVLAATAVLFGLCVMAARGR